MPENEGRTITRRGLLALGAAAVPAVALAVGLPRAPASASAAESRSAPDATPTTPVYYFC